MTERTNASTTGLLNTDGSWDDDLCESLGLPAGTSVTTAAAHDTASAVVAVPMDAASAAHISRGTWALLGVELPGPVLSDEGRLANFTSEVGADGRTRYLHNMMGLWLLSETIRQFERDGTGPTWPSCGSR
ncbi:FGGY-family carbohydrate kinase [Mycolicibacterium pyrenivorans]|uniref:FGGY-family carbohydrate kinase n=1 Tax=Mycolicibacterium pyrenivorans TaxID=187102 RepID=UPI0021F2ECDF|nr:FGGY-family carbohydrate kinase [Mycolicibacterium pyrenivorans]MCV7152092.1 hypothetical protein [Mycolicibacterium pyrenivorans]